MLLQLEAEFQWLVFPKILFASFFSLKSIWLPFSVMCNWLPFFVHRRYSSSIQSPKCSKWPKVAQNGINGPKWPKMAQSGPNAKYYIYLLQKILGHPVYNRAPWELELLWELINPLKCNSIRRNGVRHIMSVGLVIPVMIPLIPISARAIFGAYKYTLKGSTDKTIDLASNHIFWIRVGYRPFFCAGNPFLIAAKTFSDWSHSLIKFHPKKNFFWIRIFYGERAPPSQTASDFWSVNHNNGELIGILSLRYFFLKTCDTCSTSSHLRFLTCSVGW